MADKNQTLTTADIAGTSDRAQEPAPVPAKEMGNGGSGAARPEPLLPGAQADQFRSRWTSIQTDFVDEPKKSVEEADALVAEVMKQIAETFAKERSNLESQWSQGSDVSTEDLRQALRRYRSFFDRLLSV